MKARLPDLEHRAPKKEGAFVERIVLQNRHHENKSLEISKPQYRFQVEMPTRTAWLLAVRKSSRRRRRAREARAWLWFTNCVFDNNATRPGTGPLSKHAILF